MFHFLYKRGTPLQQEDLPWSQRWSIAFDIAKALHHLQTRVPPVVHRDLRSPNIFIHTNGTALVGDFGLGKKNLLFDNFDQLLNVY